jgi:hypothetical protein
VVSGLLGGLALAACGWSPPFSTQVTAGRPADGGPGAGDASAADGLASASADAAPAADAAASAAADAGGAAAADAPWPRLTTAEVLQQFVAAGPECPASTRHCFELHLHVVFKDGAPVKTPDWMVSQLSEAHRTFGPLGMGFRIGRVLALDESFADIGSRAARDRLVKFHRPKEIHVFVVERLADVDEPGEIRGVHWRYRPDPLRRYVIQSALAGELVLSHELGHFFGLPHSGYRHSLMNKRKREHPPWNERVFVPPEQRRIESTLKEMLEQGDVRPAARRRR